MIAITHIQLAANALGRGATFTGSINIASQSYPLLIEILGLPEGSQAVATLSSKGEQRQVQSVCMVVF